VELGYGERFMILCRNKAFDMRKSLCFSPFVRRVETFRRRMRDACRWHEPAGSS